MKPPEPWRFILTSNTHDEGDTTWYLIFDDDVAPPEHEKRARILRAAPLLLDVAQRAMRYLEMTRPPEQFRRQHQQLLELHRTAITAALIPSQEELDEAALYAALVKDKETS